ncbi:pyridine nucleotide-disulfide oxidoreductase [Rhodococcoides trifolii]|uniref:Pyridine nucleotide-disulfide oxidoreductase n=1 Tax=Rhodococcoides trifolii TaxID=908250 RepID=A0A917G0E6_9NOCA|nr:FAD/NAD(P)-binding oxidoreductase [Rhodococcus trifolii]GGG15792.1 pyridine nucleotide-disulfide oxidoreductase [Rhodococcus trifolii]
MSGKSHFDVLIVGGGNAGISAAGRLMRQGVKDVAVIEPQKVHTYRPLLPYVGAGEAPLRSAERTQRSVTPRGCTWLEDTVVAVDARLREVRCASGLVYTYDDLVLGTGLVPDTAALPGVYDALATSSVASNYLDRAEKTWASVQSLHDGGKAVFTVPRPPVSCTGTTIKPLFLAADHWKRHGRKMDITLVVDRREILGVPDLDSLLFDELSEWGVRVLRGTAVSELHPGEQAITVTAADGGTERLDYDFLHLVPPYRGHTWVEESGLATAHGLVDIDPHTLQHKIFANIWALGDGAAVETDPSGGGLRKQASVMVSNLLAVRSGGQTTNYEGYTVAPIAVGRHTLVLGEYDRSGAVMSSLPSFMDALKPRRWAWAFDRFVLPVVYWRLILKGLA